MNSPAQNLKNFGLPALVAAAFVFLYAGVLAKLGFDWWTDDNYSHGLLVPFIIGFIIWSEFDRLKRAAGKPDIWFGGAAVTAALLLFLGGTLGAELFVQRVSLVVMLAGTIVYFYGRQILRTLIVPFLLLLFSIPIPQIVFNKIAFPLQIYASQIAVWVIRLVGVPTLRKGNVIEILPNGATQIIALEVVEACSGIRSLMTLVTLALILVYFTRKQETGASRDWLTRARQPDVWRAVVLMFSAVPIAVLTNAGRVAVTGVLTYYYGKRATESFWHELSGWLVFSVALGLLFLLNLVLKKVFSRRRVRKAAPETEDPATGFAAARDRSAAVLLIVTLVTGGLFINWLERRGEAEVARRALTHLPGNLGEWRQKGSEIRFSPQTESVLGTTDYTMREYALPAGRIANLYVGYYASQRTGATYHSPQNCLPGAGWVMTEPETVEITTPAGKTFTANRYRLENGVYNEIMIYWYQGRGRREASEYRDKINTVWDSLARRRSDGALVRVMTSVGGDEAAATRAAIDLSGRLADQLSDFVPE